LDAVGKMKKNVAPLPEEDQKKILGENALALYGIS
jgi:predicted TIM-barrel fold metal-dependent hydrolase